MNKLILPDYNNSIVNLACSIRAYFELDNKHNTLKRVDDILRKKSPKNVIVILFDGMGSKLLKNKLNKDSFLLKHLDCEISSVAPSTTTAATTSMLSGLTPLEHNYLGWDIYVKDENKIVTMFTNKIKDTDIEAAPYNIAKKYFPCQTITNGINEAGKYYSKIVSHFCDDPYTDIDDMFIKIKENLYNKEKNYIYAYYEGPDDIMHITGTNSAETNNCFKMINEKVEKFSNEVDDSIIIVIADHGHINCDTVKLSDYPDIFDTLDGDIWLEGRMCSFKIKDDRDKDFEDLFNRYFGNDFILKTKDEVIEEKLFGDGIENKYFRDSLGDYFALAVGNKKFKYNIERKVFKSTHAGFTEDEMKIPLIIIDRTK